MVEQSRQREGALVLLTRPKAQSLRFAQGLARRFEGLSIVVSPLMETRLLTPMLPGGQLAGLIFTSETAVLGYTRLSADRSVPAWCVGDRTAQIAAAEGFAVRSAGGDAAALVTLILKSGERGPLLHARGADVAGPLRQCLHEAGVDVLEAVVYEQVPARPTAEATLAMKGHAPVLLPLFSPRSARLAAEAFGERLAPLHVAALSEAVALAASGLGPEMLAVAARPDEAAMLDAVGSLLGRAGSP